MCWHLVSLFEHQMDRSFQMLKVEHRGEVLSAQPVMVIVLCLPQFSTS